MVRFMPISKAWKTQAKMAPYQAPSENSSESKVQIKKIKCEFSEKRELGNKSSTKPRGQKFRRVSMTISIIT